MSAVLHHLLRDAARRWPGQTAIETPKGSVTYEELDRRSDQLAAALIERGCTRGDRVAILCQKSIEAYVAVYGVLKAGCAYVPLDRKAPVARLRYIVDDCAVSAMVMTAETAKTASQLAEASATMKFSVSYSATADQFSALPLVDATGIEATALTALPRTDVVDSDLAYILYTSGSTGSPKGVMISHLNSMSFVRWSGEYADVRPGERVSGHAPLHFDLSIFDIFATARHGGVLVPVPDGLSTFPGQLLAWLRRTRINVLYCVPSALVMIAQQPDFASADFPDLRVVIFAGEVFPAKFLQSWVDKLPAATLMNWYGPTETNVITAYSLQPGERVERPVPIGKACENVDVFLVDEDGQRNDSAGHEGELCARGSFVALGYWGDEAKTARAFHVNPALHERVYRTGDIVTKNRNGDYEYIGRRDHMVKSRGYRIELGEVESALYQIEGIQEAAVVPLPDEVIGNVLVACVSPTDPVDESLWTAEVMSRVAQRLPGYMVPARLRVFAGLPKTSTGKIDRQRLLQEVSATTQGSTDGSGI